MSTTSPDSAHPEHRAVVRRARGVVEPARPAPGSGWVALQRRRACRRDGGHWWHPVTGMGVDWFCCQCGTERQGPLGDGR
jgi:hypothetical protein